MEKQMKFVVMLSLKEMALRRVAVLLSNDCKIPSGRCFRSVDDRKRWLNTNEDKIKYKISKLQLPESLRKEMVDKGKSICLEIWKWEFSLWDLLRDNMRFEEICVEIGFTVLYWTTAGTIDYNKTAEALLGCEVLDAKERYKLACRHCMEDYIPFLWEALSEDGKECFLSKTGVLPSLEFCWPCILKGELSDLDRLWITLDRNLTSFNQFAFESSAKAWNKMATEYFFRKMTLEEREVSLMRTALDVLSKPPSGFCFGSFPDVVHYLLSLMTPEQQMETIKEVPDISLCFIVTSWQDLLVENVRHIWPFLESDYEDLLDMILLFLRLDLCHPKSFQEFFVRSPLDLKKYFVHEYAGSRNLAYRFLFRYFTREDLDSILCIFRNLDPAHRAAIVFKPKVLYLFRCFLGIKRHMVKVCLREAELCKEDRERLKKRCPDLRRVIVELYEYHETVEKEMIGQKRKLENCPHE